MSSQASTYPSGDFPPELIRMNNEAHDKTDCPWAGLHNKEHDMSDNTLKYLLNKTLETMESIATSHHKMSSSIEENTKAIRDNSKVSEELVHAIREQRVEMSKVIHTNSELLANIPNQVQDLLEKQLEKMPTTSMKWASEKIQTLGSLGGGLMALAAVLYIVGKIAAKSLLYLQ